MIKFIDSDQSVSFFSPKAELANRRKQNIFVCKYGGGCQRLWFFKFPDW